MLMVVLKKMKGMGNVLLQAITAATDMTQVSSNKEAFEVMDYINKSVVYARRSMFFFLFSLRELLSSSASGVEFVHRY